MWPKVATNDLPSIVGATSTADQGLVSVNADCSSKVLAEVGQESWILVGGDSAIDNRGSGGRVL